MWQCESTNTETGYEVTARVGAADFDAASYIVCVGGSSQCLAEHPFDAPRRRAGLVRGELHADALRSVALHAFGRDPDHLALHGDALRIIHQRQQHEDFLAELVGSIGRNEDAAALEKRHVRGV